MSLMIPLVPREVRVRLGHVRRDVALASGEEGRWRAMRSLVSASKSERSASAASAGRETSARATNAAKDASALRRPVAGVAADSSARARTTTSDRRADLARSRPGGARGRTLGASGGAEREVGANAHERRGHARHVRDDSRAGVGIARRAVPPRHQPPGVKSDEQPGRADQILSGWAATAAGCVCFLSDGVWPSEGRFRVR